MSSLREKMIRVAILGATGYTALEAMKILLRHPGVEITAVTSRSKDALPLQSVHPSMAQRIDLKLENLGPPELAERADCVFSCLPHGVACRWVPELLATGTSVVDFSADYRLNDAEVYKQWYGLEHPDPGRLGQVVYGLPELFREEIRGAQMVANPGCYPTSAILAMVPFLKSSLVDTDEIIFDSESGVSGAGRTPKMATLFPECNESMAPYSVGQHRHTPEIEQLLQQMAGLEVNVIFTPHLVPMDRGILSTGYARLTSEVTEQEAMKVLRSFYADEPFVRVVNHLPATKHTVGTNFCDITVRKVRGQLLTFSCIDNLIKGASGAAIQNFNLMFGFDETTAL